MLVKDNGTYPNDGDIINYTLTATGYTLSLLDLIPNQTSLSLTSSDQLVTKDLKSVKNKIRILATLTGQVQPSATVGIQIVGVEASPTSDNFVTKDYSLALPLYGFSDTTLECRRKKSSAPGKVYNPSKPETAVTYLRPNLESPTSWFQQRLQCVTEAHHIVSSYRTGDKAYKQIMVPCGIDINSDINGVPLPNTMDTPIEGYVHSGRHTNVYHQRVYTDLKAAFDEDRKNGNVALGQCPLVQEEFQKIREALQKKNYVWP